MGKNPNEKRLRRKLKELMGKLRGMTEKLRRAMPVTLTN
jgi:hypothetical protein